MKSCGSLFMLCALFALLGCSEATQETVTAGDLVHTPQAGDDGAIEAQPDLGSSSQAEPDVGGVLPRPEADSAGHPTMPDVRQGDTDGRAGDMADADLDASPELPNWLPPETPGSSNQKCLCYPDGTFCDSKVLGSDSDISDPAMKCPEGEVCNGGYVDGGDALQQYIDWGWVGLCKRRCTEVQGVVSTMTDELCPHGEKCVKLVIDAGIPEPHPIAWDAVCGKPIARRVKP